MIEVGTTNRTRLEDYRRAITDQTRLIMRVHPSNYRVVGFTATPKLEELVALAHDHRLPIYEDAGSGVVNDLTEYGLADEPLIRDSIGAGVDVVSFSGDKLLGSAQAGMIVGKQAVIERLRKHSMYRALRVDKLCLAALEATLESHRRGASEEIPTLRMLAISEETLHARATAFVANLADVPQMSASVIKGNSAIGGGSGPNVHPPTWLVAIEKVSIAVEEIERQLRSASSPIIARIAEDRLLLDLRTVEPSDEPEILNALKSVS
jgi:L-seryl-tRNA(Ser) seleniumtransferase